jgi:hypothetical protein
MPAWLSDTDDKDRYAAVSEPITAFGMHPKRDQTSLVRLCQGIGKNPAYCPPFQAARGRLTAMSVAQR